MQRLIGLKRSLAVAFVTVLTQTVVLIPGLGAVSNPQYRIDPQAIFPSLASITPRGSTYTDTVPDTLDPAEIAKLFLHGAAAENVPFGEIWLPGGAAYFSPANRIRDPSCDNAPCVGFIEGYPNWGKVALGFFLAREISGHDLKDVNRTLSAEHRSLTNMLSWDTVVALRQFAQTHRDLRLGGFNLTFASRLITPSSTIMQALVARYREDPGNQPLRDAINEYVSMHQKMLTPHEVDGQSLYDFLGPSTDVPNSNRIESFTGYLGEYANFANIDGRAATVMFEWYDLSGDRTALDIGTKLTTFLRSFSPLWADPDPSRFGDNGPGSFAGHIHGYLQAAHAFTAEAAVRLKMNPRDPIARQDMELANNMYQFVKRRTKCDVLGNFGTTTPLEDMIRLGIDLSELGMGPYWEEVERWTRNTLADRQIDSVTAQRYIGNRSTSAYNTDDVGDKVTGLWFSDATHSLAIPQRAWMFNLDNAVDPMHALYEVWAHTIDLQGSVAEINFDLNRAGRYLDVKSDLPYRGQVSIDMKREIGPIRAIDLRIPSWADRDRVSVAVQDATGDHTLVPSTDWIWAPNLYVHIARVVPSQNIIVRFPIRVYQRQFHDIRSEDQFWYEGDYGSPQRHAAETMQTFVGIFRGDTLVDARPRPVGGIPRYQRQALATLPVSDVAPPMIAVQRFVPTNAHTP
jgi:hypothetical protein